MLRELPPFELDSPAQEAPHPVEEGDLGPLEERRQIIHEIHRPSDEEIRTILAERRNSFVEALILKGVPEQDAEDVAHNAIAYAIAHVSEFRMKDPIKWLVKIANRQLSDLREARSAIPARVSFEQEARALSPDDNMYLSKMVQTPEEALMSKSEIEFLMGHLDLLSPEEHEMIELTIEGYKPREIAEMKGMTSSQVSTALFNARDRMRNRDKNIK